MEMTREQLGQFIKETRKRYGKSRQNFAKKMSLSPDILLSVEMGSCVDDELYIKALAELLRRIVPRKIKLKKIPAGLPNREELESMKSGNCDNMALYVDVIQALCKMPDLPPKKEKTSVVERISYKISEKTAKRNEIIFAWKRWFYKNVEGDIVNSILNMVDLNKCKLNSGSFSYPKILDEYLRMYRIVNEQNKKKNSTKTRNKHYGKHSQITRKEWGSPYKPARG